MPCTSTCVLMDIANPSSFFGHVYIPLQLITSSPIKHFQLTDLEAHVVNAGQAGNLYIYIHQGLGHGAKYMNLFEYVLCITFWFLLSGAVPVCSADCAYSCSSGF